jgi:hypothetical protein
MLTDATIACYYRKGIETALLSREQAQAWADAVIAKSDAPPYACIEVSLSKDIPEIISALRSVPGDFDATNVGAWLLAELQQEEIQTTDELASAIRKAMLVCQHCGMCDETYYEFDGIDDSLYLARHEQFGSVDECRADFVACLQRNSCPFPGAAEAQPCAAADGSAAR